MMTLKQHTELRTWPCRDGFIQPTVLVIKLNTALIRHNTVFKRLSAAAL